MGNTLKKNVFVLQFSAPILNNGQIFTPLTDKSPPCVREGFRPTHHLLFVNVYVMYRHRNTQHKPWELGDIIESRHPTLNLEHYDKSPWFTHFTYKAGSSKLGHVLNRLSLSSVGYLLRMNPIFLNVSYLKIEKKKELEYMLCSLSI